MKKIQLFVWSLLLLVSMIFGSLSVIRLIFVSFELLDFGNLIVVSLSAIISFNALKEGKSNHGNHKK
jgi:hypothetical protein